MKKLSLHLLIVFFLFTNWVLAQKTWTGATSTAWNTAGNWSPGGVPASTDNVVIPSAPANQPAINGTTSPVCNNLTVNSGSLLTISGISAANAQITVAGTATFNGGLSIGGILAKIGKIVATNIVCNSTSTLSAFLGARCEVSGHWTFSSGSSLDFGQKPGNCLVFNCPDLKVGAIDVRGIQGFIHFILIFDTFLDQSHKI